MRLFFQLCLLSLFFSCQSTGRTEKTLLHVSYDPTRALYQEYTAWFEKEWHKETGEDVEIRQSHGGSTRQAYAVMQGLQADMVSLALGWDIDQIAVKTKCLSKDWRERLPNQSAPSSSILVFVVREGNPKKIQDWSDLVQKGIRIVVPNPKTSGAGKWAYLAAYGYAKETLKEEKAVQAFLRNFYDHVPLFESGSRSAATNFAYRKQGDVLVTWENEAAFLQQEFPEDSLEVIIPSLTVEADLPVAWLDCIVDRKGTRDIAEAYIKGLYLPTAQRIFASHFFRPVDPVILQEFAYRFPQVKSFTIRDFGGWEKVQADHFDPGGWFETLTTL